MNMITHPQLSNFTPSLPETFLANLSALNIRTAPDLVFSSPAELFKKLPPGSITFPELSRHIAHVRNAFAGPALTGDQLIVRELDARAGLASVRSGLPALDELVGNTFGGASGGRIVEISGTGASGKTVRRNTLHPWVVCVKVNRIGAAKVNGQLFCDDLRHSRSTSSCITSSRTPPTLRCGSIPPAISHPRASPRSHRVRFVCRTTLCLCPPSPLPFPWR
jgi:hypothetical protein